MEASRVAKKHPHFRLVFSELPVPIGGVPPTPPPFLPQPNENNQVTRKRVKINPRNKELTASGGERQDMIQYVSSRRNPQYSSTTSRAAMSQRKRNPPSKAGASLLTPKPLGAS